MNFRPTPEDSLQPVPQHLLDRIAADLLSDLQPVKPLASARRTTLSLLALAALVIAVFIARLGWAGWSKLSGLEASIVLGILAASTSLVAYSLSHQMAPGSRRTFRPAVLLMLPLVALAAASGILFPAEQTPKFLAAGFRCWRAGIACAAVVAPMFWLVLRRGFPLAPVQHGATAGLLAGLTGATVLTIECNYLDSLHLNTWHMGAALTAMGIGAGIGRFAVARRRRTA